MGLAEPLVLEDFIEHCPSCLHDHVHLGRILRAVLSTPLSAVSQQANACAVGLEKTICTAAKAGTDLQDTLFMEALYDAVRTLIGMCAGANVYTNHKVAMNDLSEALLDARPPLGTCIVCSRQTREQADIAISNDRDSNVEGMSIKVPCCLHFHDSKAVVEAAAASVRPKKAEDVQPSSNRRY